MEIWYGTWNYRWEEYYWFCWSWNWIESIIIRIRVIKWINAWSLIVRRRDLREIGIKLSIIENIWV